MQSMQLFRSVLYFHLVAITLLVPIIMKALAITILCVMAAVDAFAPPALRTPASRLSQLRMAEEDEYDMVVIGAGSGGVRCSRISAGYGKKVAIIEPQLQHGAPNYSAIGGTVS